MSRIILIISRKQLVWIAASLAVAAILSFFLSRAVTGFSRYIQTTNDINMDECEKLTEENEKLGSILEGLTPKEEKTLYMEDYRNPGGLKLSSKPEPIPGILQKGRKVDFRVLLHDPGYVRPVFDPNWKYFFFRDWLYLPQKVYEARHKLFVYQGGLSNIFDFEGSIGFHKEIPVDYHREVNFLLFHFRVREIKKSGCQIVLMGEPAGQGAQIVAVRIADVLPESSDQEVFLIQMVTPGGYEIDYAIEPYGKSDYLKKLEDAGKKQGAGAGEKNGMRQDEGGNLLLFGEEKSLIMERLKNRNKLLKEALARYIPLEDRFLTEVQCEKRIRPGIQGNGRGVENTWTAEDARTAVEKGGEIKYRVHYQNPDYKRPIYHPAWRKNADKGWSYIPEKICDGLHSLFMIPRDVGSRADFFEKQAFYEKIVPLKADEAGFLVYGFAPRKAVIYQNRLVVTGVPARNGACILAFDTKQFAKGEDWITQLVTPDFYEIDSTLNKDIYREMN